MLNFNDFTNINFFYFISGTRFCLLLSMPDHVHPSVTHVLKKLPHNFSKYKISFNLKTSYLSFPVLVCNQVSDVSGVFLEVQVFLSGRTFFLDIPGCTIIPGSKGKNKIIISLWNLIYGINGAQFLELSLTFSFDSAPCILVFTRRKKRWISKS